MSAEKSQGAAAAPAAGQHAKAAGSFPFKLLTVALVLTAVILTGLAWQARSTYSGFESMHTQHARLQQLMGIIDRLDEVLTMSAHMYAATGDAKWERRYRLEEPKLDVVIKEARRLAPGLFVGEAARKTDVANAKLVAMEKRAFALAAGGNREAALQLLSSSKYWQQKNAYSDGLHEAKRGMDERVASEFKTRGNSARYAVVSVSVALPALLVGWLGVLRMLRRHVAEREHSVAALHDVDMMARERAEAALAESEEQYHTLVENVNIGVYRNTGGPKGRFLQANTAIAQMFGYDTVEDFMRVNVSDLYQDPAERQLFVDEALKHGFVKDQELRLKRKDGTAIWASCTAKIKYGENGEILWLDGVIEDITERKAAEQALKRSEERYRALFEGAAEGILVAEAETREFRYANPAICSMLGYTEDELTGMSVADIHSAESRDHALAEFELQAAGKRRLAMDIPCLRQDGTVLYADINTATAVIDGTLCAIGFFRDATERREAEERIRVLNANLEQRVAERTDELHKSREQYRTLAESAQEFIFTVDHDYHILYANTYAARQVRRAPETVIGKSIKDVLPRSAALALEHHLQSVYKSDQPVSVEEEITLTEPAGKPVWLDLRLVPLRDEDGDTVAVLVIAHDITRRKDAERAMRESEERYRGVVEDQTEYISRFRPDGAMTFVNRACSHLLGKEPEELVGQSFFPCLPDEDAKRLKAQLALLGPESPAAMIEHKISTPDGSVLWQRWTNRAIFDSAGRCIEYQGVGRDVTEQKRAEEALQAAARHWQTTFDALSSSVCLLGMDGTVRQCNEAMATFVGKTPAEVEGSTCWELVHGSSEPVEDCPFVRARESGHKETRVFHVGDRWLDVSVDPVLDDDGRMAAAVHVISDITERMRAERALRDSEESYRILAESAQEDIFIIDQDCRVQYSNDYAAAQAGTTPDAIIGRTLQGLFPPQTAERLEASIRTVLGSGESLHVENTISFADAPDSEIWLDTILTPLKNEAGDAEAVLGISRDVTDRKQAEAALRQSEQRFRSVYETAPLAFVLWDTDMRINGWNRRAKELFGWTRKEALGQSIFDMIIPEGAQSDVKGVVDALLRGEVVDHHTNENVTKNGDIITCEWNNSILRDEDGKIVGVMSLALDITERRRTEQALRDSEARYRAMFDQAIDSVVLFDPKTGAILEFNDAAHENLGYTGEEFAKLSLADIDVVETPEATRQHIENIVGGDSAVFETKHRRKDGDIRDVQVSSGTVLVHDKHLLLSIWRDVTEVKRSHERIERQAAILANVTDAVAVARDDRTIVYWNKGAEQMFGSTEAEMLGRTGLDELLRSPDQAEELADEILSIVDEEGGWTHNRLPCRHKDGRDMWVHVTASRIKAEPDEPAGVLLVAKDVTEEVQLHERLIRSERLAAIGTLAAGVAHEMNNLLGGLRGLSDLAAKDEAVVSRLIDSARTVAERGGSITARLTSLARADQPGGDRRVDLPVSAKTAIDMVRPLFGQRNIEVEEHYSPVPPTWISEGKVFQVLLNLFVNACDSIERDGTVSVSVDHDEKPDELVITVSDTGAGIRPEDIPQLFDPFFTTKRGEGESGKPSHLGLGLPESRDIVRDYGGDITVESVLGQGATFTVRLPVRPAPAEAAPTASAADAMPEQGTPILVVDDDALMRFWLTRHLEQEGYKVTAVDNGGAAVTACGKTRFPYVFLDLLMPGELDGVATLRKLKAVRPDARVIIISAFARDTIPPDCLDAAHAVLKKPFGVEELVRAFAGEDTPA